MNVMIVGVGGQGTLLASRILGNIVIDLGYDVKVSAFVYYLFQSSFYRRMLEDILSGSAINNLNASQVEELTFNIPTDIKEQYAIADTLTAMDDEIAVLQMERDKYANIRAGMMDDLLTGAKRI